MPPSQQPLHPLEAVTHPNPTPYYHHLAHTQPFHWNQHFGGWVASSAEAVTDVLNSDFCRVRPIKEPIPTHLLGSAAGDLFGNWARMNDGDLHRTLKSASTRAFETLTPVRISEQSQRWAELLFPLERTPNTFKHLNSLCWNLPIYTVASLLGVLTAQLPEVAALLHEFSLCLSPLSTTPELERGKQAATRLQDLVKALLEQGESNSILTVLARGLDHSEQGMARAVANGVGFLWQSFEATAGLLGNALLVLSEQQGLRNTLLERPEQMENFVVEVARTHSPIQNTRRYVERDGILCGQSVQAGDSILVLLAAASLDSSIHPNPEKFDLEHSSNKVFTFGVGSHACPGKSIAVSIAGAGVTRVLSSRVDWEKVASSVSYLRSSNARLPVWEVKI